MCALETLTQMFISCPRDTLELLVKKKMLNQTKLYETEIGKPSLIITKIVLLDIFLWIGSCIFNKTFSYFIIMLYTYICKFICIYVIIFLL